MSAKILFATKKRDISMLYSASRVSANSTSETPRSVHNPCYDQGWHPPSKRHRLVNGTKAMEDIFGDGEDFTADDLEEIDILATQAFTQKTEAVNAHKNQAQGNVLSSKQSTSNFLQPQRPALQRQGRDLLNSSNDNNDFGLEVLQSRHEDLNQKLKVLHDEVVIKNGEIKVLRDALHQTESSLEQQKIAHVLVEKEKAQIQCEKEKELLKKIQSLQSELQFKDAEMNELKSRLQSCERRTVAPQVSPKNSGAIKLDVCPSPQPGKICFPTKESFRANASLKPYVPVSPQPTHLPVIQSEHETVHTTVKQAKIFSSSGYTQRMNSHGSVLLNTLMQQSDPLGLPGLCHLLSCNLDVLPGSPVHRGHSSNTAGTSTTLSPSRCFALRDYQKLAITGLNSIALGEEVMQKKVSQSQSVYLHLNKMSRLAGAVLILPLVECHIAAYCQALQSLEKSGVSPSDNKSISSSNTCQSMITSVEDTVSSLAEPALASLRILYHLVFYSLDVVETLLQKTLEGEMPSPLTPEAEQESTTLKHGEMDNEEQNLHPLFKKIVLLLSSTVVTYKRDIIREQVLQVLVKLAENSPNELLCSFQVLFTSPVLLQCLSADAPLSVAHKAVRLLALLADHNRLASLFCSCSESCVLLVLYTYVISRPDKHASETLWLQFEHEMVRFLNKLITQGWSSSSSESGLTCQCNREVVKALVLTLHQEWLRVRRLTLLLTTPDQNKSMQLLRETLMMLHSLFQKDKNFSEHCLEVLHQYDQAVPGVRGIFRKYSILNESEEFALDELCPPEVETEDESMDCT
ncbi:ATR-interacting protein [Mixophyes fleayi]|uniref:ATR-interacting protein n=1 Tax=Mixophyes fleayi TaxID=3061075 RepID=UPI003F4E416C